MCNLIRRQCPIKHCHLVDGAVKRRVAPRVVADHVPVGLQCSRRACATLNGINVDADRSPAADRGRYEHRVANSPLTLICAAPPQRRAVMVCDDQARSKLAKTQCFRSILNAENRSVRRRIIHGLDNRHGRHVQLRRWCATQINPAIGGAVEIHRLVGVPRDESIDAERHARANGSREWVADIIGGIKPTRLVEPEIHRWIAGQNDVGKAHDVIQSLRALGEFNPSIMTKPP